MAQGDTLKHTTSDGSPIIFSEWSSRGRMVQRTEYTFESILAQSGPTGTVQNASEQLDLFAGTDAFDDTSKSKPTKPRYAICNWVIYINKNLKVRANIFVRGLTSPVSVLFGMLHCV